MPADEQGVTVPLSLFSGMISELSPPDLPAGVSPDCQDVAFLPGSVSNRPCLSRLFAAISGSPTILYSKTFVQPNEDPLNLFLDSANNLWQEDVGNNPGVLSLLSAITEPVGSILQGLSVSAFGREYLALSDGRHGAHVPLQFDGTYLDRVTQDGPGAPPTVADISYPIVSISRASSTGIITVTINVAYASRGTYLNPGYLLTIAGVTADPSLNGSWPISAVASASGGTETQLTCWGAPGSYYISGITRVSGTSTVTATLAETPATSVGNLIVVTGTIDPSFAGEFTITGINGNQVVWTQAGANSTSSGGTLYTENITAAVIAVQLPGYQNGPMSIALQGDQLNTFPTGSTITVTGNSVSGYNTSYTAGTAAPVYGANGLAGLPGSGPITVIYTNTPGGVPEGAGVGGTATYSLPASTPAASGVAGPYGLISPGIHEFALGFVTRQGYVTDLSPTGEWNAGGGFMANVSGILTGPSNVVARILCLTGAGGANFFYIPVTATIPGIGYVQGTQINDNVSTGMTLNFADNQLFSATSVDVSGRNYFAQVVLGDCLGVFYYASRMWWWGERNKVNNLLNMGFEGSASTISAWTATTGTGSLINGGAWAAGQAWLIATDNAGTDCGIIQQGAFEDEYGNAIAQPSTLYTFRCWAQLRNEVGIGSGNITARFYSPTSGVLATCNIPLTAGGRLNVVGGFISGTFSGSLPAVIPSDTLLQVWASSTGWSSAPNVVIDELQIIPANQPYRDTTFRVSYVNAPEQMDGVTGVLGSTSDPTPLRNCFEIRGTMYFNTAQGMNYTVDNGSTEPYGWSVPEVSQAIGSLSVHGTDPGRAGSGESGEQYQFIANEAGVYLFGGGEQVKISQEIQSQTANGMPGWDQINQAAVSNIWIKNDRKFRRLYVGVPTELFSYPNVIFVLDYRELNDFWTVAGNAALRQSYTGRMIAQEFCRKWTRWNISANTGEMLARAINEPWQICFGAGNGENPGSATGFGNVYSLTTTKLTDDDYGQVTPYYTTYMFVSRDQEQQLGLDSHRKEASYLSAFLSGSGLSAISLLSDTLANVFETLPAYALTAAQSYDYEWNCWTLGDRIAVKVGSVPVAGGTDNAFNLQHIALTLKKDPIAPLRGSV